MNKNVNYYITRVFILSAVILISIGMQLSTQKEAAAEEENHGDNEAFVKVVPITFSVEKYTEIPLDNGEAFDPRVSPDGNRIVCVKKGAAGKSLAMVDLKQNKVITLTINLDDISQPSWSPDGKKIVFAASKQGVSEIYLYDLDAKKLFQVTNDPARKKSWPRVSPYSFEYNYRIAYVSEQNDRKDIWWVRGSGEFDYPITLPSERIPFFAKSFYWGESPKNFVTVGGDMPEWSPSGEMITYKTNEGSNGCLIYETWWGKAELHLPQSGTLSWAPNQESILSYEEKTHSALVISLDGSLKASVLKDKHLTSQPVYFPDGKGLAYTFSKGGRSILAIEPYNDPLGDISNLWQYSYTRSQKDKLVENQLLLLDGDFKQIYTIYDAELYSGSRPYLVTSDAVLETFYAAFSALYSYVERDELLGTVREFALQGAQVARQTSAPADVQRLFLTGLGLIDKNVADNAPMEVKKEIACIVKAEGKGRTIFDQKIDYSDFFIRGKYERDTDLQGLFRALKWFQAFTFDLKDSKDRKILTDILTVVNTPKVRVPLERLNTIYKELIGESRYYGPLTLKSMPKSGSLPDIQPLLPWVKIKDNYRFFPVSYTLDAHIFDELITHTDRPDSVGTKENPRLLPKGLDIFAAFGSIEARDILLNELNEGRYKNYEKKLDELSRKISQFPSAIWEQNIYTGWLSMLNILTENPQDKFPQFTSTKAWQRKEISTALSSWVNLRYETIAAVEQVGAEAGEGGYERLTIGNPRGYVEPNPQFFRRLNENFGKIERRFEQVIQNPELRKSVSGRINEYRLHLSRLEEIAKKEVSNVMLTDEDYTEILYIGRTIEHFILIMNSLGVRDEEGEGLKKPDEIRKIVDVQKYENTHLYEAIGYVNEINVVVPFYGRRQIVKGPVYSYYEFGSEDLLNSEKWKESDKYSRPGWIEPFFDGESQTPGSGIE